MSTNMSSDHPAGDEEIEIEQLLSSRLIVVANLLRRSAAIRYARALGLSPVEFGIVAMLGRRSGTPVRTLAALLGMDRAQVSRALAGLVQRAIVTRETSRLDQRDVLVALTPSGIEAHDVIIAMAGSVNRQLIEAIPDQHRAVFDAVLSHLKARAETLLETETGAKVKATRSP